jgi:hypothetical protein
VHDPVDQNRLEVSVILSKKEQDLSRLMICLEAAIEAETAI